MAKTEAKIKNLRSQKYAPGPIELKWQHVWDESGLYHPELSNAKQPFYNLMMFPYPSAEGLHVGNMYAFTGADVYGRYKRMHGLDVFEPIGLDGFGIHSENYALKIHRHPMDQAKISEDNFYRQLRTIGNGYDWTRTVETYKEDYYKWTQWVFIELFKAGLAYRKKSPVNFCPSCKTVLADEQVIEGACERCGSIVEKRDLEQWFFRITSYAERLLKNIETLNWSDKVKIAQRMWIGKKEGTTINYKIEGNSNTISVFTTRPDTNFGATFIAVAPEHILVDKIISGEIKVAKAVISQIQAYIRNTKKKSDIDRRTDIRDKTGVFTGLYALNLLTGFSMPIWVSDFVLMDFGTGALVGVPGHDKRDFEFAQKFKLKVIRVVTGKDNDLSPITTIDQVQEDEGVMVNSGFLNGMDIKEAHHKISDYMQEKGYAKKEVSYHIRDWLISRQRYWGPPIPMIYCASCAEKDKSWFSINGKDKNMDWDCRGWFPEPLDSLPVALPFIEEYKPIGTGKAPLGNYPEFYEVNCPECGSKAKRETDVSDTFLDSSWYFFRYVSTQNEKSAFDQSIVKKWLPVTMYIGGAEHSVLHLLYSRFITMVFKDLGIIDFEEPFSRFYAHGLIIKDGAKMSKSKGNVVIPDDYIKKFGADTLRTYLMFLGPFSQGGDFRDTGIEGTYRFLKRVWTLFTSQEIVSGPVKTSANTMLHKTVKGVTDDLNNLHYNTAIAKLMTYYNFLSKEAKLSKNEAEVFLQLLAPFAPFMTEELWEYIGNPYSIHKSKWPEYNTEAMAENTIIIPVQVAGKLRGTITLNSADVQDKQKAIKLANQEPRVFFFSKRTNNKTSNLCPR